MANPNPNNQKKWVLRECTSWNPRVRQDICNPTYGYLGATNYLLYSWTEKEHLKQSIAFDESGKTHINSDDSIEIIGGAGFRANDKGDNLLLHTQHGNVTITADRTGCVRVSGNNVIVKGAGDIEYIAGNDFSITANNIKLNGNTVNTQALSGNQAPLEQQFLYQVFKNAKGVGGGLIGKALGIILG